jgi:hypothetical protein
MLLVLARLCLLDADDSMAARISRDFDTVVAADVVSWIATWRRD